MKITAIETFPSGAGWKNWVFVRVHTDEGISGVGEGTLNGFARTIAAAVDELSIFALGEDPRQVTTIARRLLDKVSNDGGHIHKTAVAAIEVACWDILGQSLGVPIHTLLGGQVRSSVRGYANGWYRVPRGPQEFVEAAAAVTATGLRALKLDPFGTAQDFIDDDDLVVAVAIVAELRAGLGPDFAILIDAHARFTEAEAARVADALAPYGIFWFEEPTSRELDDGAARVAARTSVRIATGETFANAGQFFALARAGGVSIWQPEPMSLGGIGPTMRVAALAASAGAWIAPHQSGGPIATAICLQLAASVENFLIQEHFDPFNEPWTRDLVSWHPAIDQGTGQLSLPDGPGLGIDFDDDVARAHPYDPNAYLDIHQEGWEKRLGTRPGPDGSPSTDHSAPSHSS
ncbi:MAG: mandelate racemase/muconate lactonizing enzyme family protein [Propionibacteriaceae bacterium]